MRNKRGFTLIEAVVALGIFSITLLFVVQAIVQSYQYQEDLIRLQRAQEVAVNYVELLKATSYIDYITNAEYQLTSNPMHLVNDEYIAPGVESTVSTSVLDPVTNKTIERIPDGSVTLTVDISDVDDAADGTGESDWDNRTVDYYDVKLTVRYYDRKRRQLVYTLPTIVANID